MLLKFYCKAALTSLSNSVTYITFLFSEWRIQWQLVGRNEENVGLMLRSRFVTLERIHRIVFRFPLLTRKVTEIQYC